MFLNAPGVVCALGYGKPVVTCALFAGDCSGMQKQYGWVDGKALTVGAVTASLPAIPPGLDAAHSRNNQLLLAAALEIEADIRQIIHAYGSHRIGVVLGTSTSGIAETETAIAVWQTTGALPADYHYARQEISAPAVFLSDWLGLSGPCYSLSVACTSSARALISAARLLRQNICDAVLVGGVDSLCKLTLNGFLALEAVAPECCNPFSSHRKGINIGEAATLFIMTREPWFDTDIALLGYGASSDAHHISAPKPDGAGALTAMRSALVSAGLQPSDIDYLNLHGTATVHNDAMESRAVATLFPKGVACSSTKPLTGHTLGAAGALEAAFCWLALSRYNTEGDLPPHLWDGIPDPSMPSLNLIARGHRFASSTSHRLMSNSFAFGGNNVSLILGNHP